MDVKAIFSKKVAGIPVMYLVAGLAIVGLIYAIKMKPAATKDMGDTGETGGPGDQGSPTSGVSNPYAGLDSTGTVVVAPQTPEPEDKVEETNDTWAKAAIDYLIENNLASPGAAQAAISAYLEGANLTYEQGLLRDAAIRKLKSPPQGITPGATADKPAQKQFSIFPGSHTVKGSNDNTAAKLSTLYYGTADNLHVDAIVSANAQYGPKTTTYNAGTVIKIPEFKGYNYYTTTKTVRTFKAIAARSGLSIAQIKALNPSRTETESMNLPIGLKVRVR